MSSSQGFIFILDLSVIIHWAFYHFKMSGSYKKYCYVMSNISGCFIGKHLKPYCAESLWFKL